MKSVIEKAKLYFITDVYPTLALSAGLIEALDFLPS